MGLFLLQRRSEKQQSKRSTTNWPSKYTGNQL